MRAPRVAAWLLRTLVPRMQRRAPDFVVGGGPGVSPYLLRWWVIPRNPLLNVYLHKFLRSDDDRALHDHPWVSASLMLGGVLIEHRFAERDLMERWFLWRAQGSGPHIDDPQIFRAPPRPDATVTRSIHAGDITLRSARCAHRLELPEGSGPVFTLFITGPRLRARGFWCQGVRWVPWHVFTDTQAGRSVTGRGCE